MHQIFQKFFFKKVSYLFVRKLIDLELYKTLKVDLANKECI